MSSKPATDGMTATASSPASRATALFVPDADAEVALVDRAEHRGGEGRDRDGQAEAEDEHAREAPS